MGLNAHDRQALALIEEALTDADPQFAARLSAFSSRLADGEPAPERERIRERRLRAVSWVARRPRAGRPGAGRPGTHSRLISWIAVAVWVSIMLTLISVALVLGNTGSATACTDWQAGLCTGETAPSTPAVPPGQARHVPSSSP